MNTANEKNKTSVDEPCTYKPGDRKTLSSADSDIRYKLKKKLRNSRIIIGVLSVLLIASVGFIFMIMFRENKTEEAFFRNVYITDETYKLTEDLQAVVDGFSSDDFKAAVKKINGYEYLTLTTDVDGKSVSLCYQNEFPDKEMKDSVMKSFIEKDGDMIALPDSYDITKPENNIPHLVNFQDGSRGFMFMELENDMPADMRLYDVSNMKKYGSINMTSTIRYYFPTEAEGEGNVVRLSNNNVSYRIEVPEDTYSEVSQNKSNSLLFADGFEYELSADALNFKAYISIGEKAYVGEYNGKITFNSVGFNMSYQRFAAYVPPNYEDPGEWQIIAPRDSYLEENIVIAGKNGGYYALEYYENIPLSEYDYERVTENGDGVRFYTDEDGKVVSKFGIDVSKFQGEIDWNEVKEQGVTFAIPRIAYRGYSVGKIVEDETFLANVNGAQEAGIDVGVYIFSQAITVEEGIEEAQYVLDAIEDLNIKGPIVFDTEYYDDPKDARANLITREERTEITKAFCETIKAAGYEPMIYANTRWLLLGIDLDSLADYEIWYAYYGEEPLLPYDFAIWQYSYEGVIEGIENYVDMNIMFRDMFSE